MSFGDVIGRSRSAEDSTGTDIKNCVKKSFFDTQLVTKTNAAGVLGADKSTQAKSVCDCPEKDHVWGCGHSGDGDPSKEFPKPTEVCDPRDPTRCVDISSRKTDEGIEYCGERKENPEDMGTCPKPPGVVTCDCEGDGYFETGPEFQALADRSLETIALDGMYAMDRADCGSCDAAP